MGAFPWNSHWYHSGVFREVTQAVAQGRSWLAQIRALIEKGRLQLVTPTPAEVLASEAFPDSLGLGEREAIALCRAHGWAFLTNDRRARNFCAEAGIEAFDVAGVLRLLWCTGIRSQKFVRRLLDRMEQSEGLVLKNREKIFEPAKKSRPR